MRARTIGIVQLARGVGKSTLATSLAGELSRFDPVALIDCDTLQGHAATWAALRQDEMYSAQLSVHRASTPGALLDRAYHMREAKGYVIIDATPDRELLAAAVALADMCLVPVQGDDPFAAAVPTLEIIRQALRRPRVRLVRTRVQSRRDPGVRKGPKLLQTCLADRNAYREALSRGRTAAETFDPVARDEVQALAMEMRFLLRPALPVLRPDAEGWPVTQTAIPTPRALFHVTG